MAGSLARGWGRRGARDSRTVRHAFFAVHVVGPIVVGGVVYLLWRSTSLTMFTWAANLGLGGAVRAIRSATHSIGAAFPKFVLFSLPDGAWAHAYVAQLCLVWREDLRRGSAWIGLGPLALLASEFGQRLGLVPGTFDAADVGMVLLGSALALAAAVLAFGNHTTRRNWGRHEV